MPSFNQCTLMGNLVRDVELKNIGATSLGDFTIAVNEKFTTKGGEKKESTMFIDCSAWGKTGEIIAQYFTKGDPILVTGSLKQDKWEDKDGNNRSKILLNVREFQFVGGRGGDSSPAPRDESPHQSSGSPAAPMDDSEPPFN